MALLNNKKSIVLKLEKVTGDPVPKITKIEVQKKTKNVLIFLDEQFEMGIDIDTLVKFNLKRATT